MTETPYQTLKIDRRGPVADVVLSRPEVHDAFNEAMIRELDRAFGELAGDAAVRVVVLRSTGKHFSAGADVNWLRQAGELDHDDNVADARRLHDMLRKIALCPKPVVARVQGAALGGGAGLVAASDFAVAAERAFFGFSEVRLGILPAVISPFVLRKLGAGTAQSLFLAGSRFGAGRARDIGLVYEVVPEAELDDAVDRLVDELLQGSPTGQAAVKRLVEEVRGRSLDQAREVTSRAIAEQRASDEGKEGLSAFLEKREPRWVPAGENGDDAASGGEGS